MYQISTMKKNIQTFIGLVLLSTITLSCGDKNSESANPKVESTGSANAEAPNTKSTLEPKDNIENQNNKNEEVLVEDKKETATPSAADTKAVDDLIKSYENTVEGLKSLFENPPMNPDAANRQLEGYETELKTIEKKINSSSLSASQKAQFAKAKAKVQL